ncbi:MAG: glycosyltransferase family 2 protein [Pseudomonadota bacterium]
MIGVIVLTFEAADVIEACLESLHVSDHPDMRVVVCDNRSSDDTVKVIRAWAEAHGEALEEIAPATQPAANLARYTLLHTGGNLGFAGGVNAGLRWLQQDPRVDLFWILNPDSEAEPGTASAYARHAAEVGPFALMGARICYHEADRRVQSDGGQVSQWTGVCRNVNSGLSQEDAVPPDAAHLDFISGANMVASRVFVERAGPMVEDYFLYYEEVDWAARRGDLPLVLCPDAKVLHHGGTVIGTGSLTRRPSPFANYFNYRNRMRFMRRFRPMALPIAWALSMLRVVKLFGLGAGAEGWAAFCGLNGMPPPASIRDRIAPADQDRAFVLREHTA